MTVRILFLCGLFIFLCGCGDEGVVSRQVLEIVSPSEAVVQSTLPDNVLSAMKRKAEQVERSIGRYFERDEPAEGWTDAKKSQWLEAKQYLIDFGGPNIDVHAQQKAMYTKYIDAGGVAIVGTAVVPDLYMLEARKAVLVMTAKYPELRERLKSKHRKFYMVLFGNSYLAGGKSELGKLPEIRWTNRTMLNHDPTDDLDALGGSCSRHGVAGLCYARVDVIGLQPVRIFIHEFTHALEWEMERLKPGFQDRLRRAYAAMSPQSWPYYEVWAYLTEEWFHRIEDGVEGRQTYEEFFAKYPLWAEILDEWFPRYTFSRPPEVWEQWEYDRWRR